MKINGKILDINGVPLSRATIIKTTGKNANKVGVSSNDDGTFELQNDSIQPEDKFEVRFIGFKSQNFSASELKNKTIKLEEDIYNLEPVLVVGKVKKKNQEQLTNNFKLHLQKHKMIYAGIGGFLGFILIFTSIKKR